MICVSIGRGRHKQTIAEHKHMVEQGAQLVELRLDYINGTVNLKRLLTDRPSGVIITCRRAEDQGKWAGTEEQRQVILRSAIAEGVEWVDLEEDIAGKIPRYGNTKRIVSMHDFRETPDDLNEIWDRLAQLDPDVIKIATMANSPTDNLRMLQMMKRATIPTVGLCMGEMGTPSRILSAKFGAPFTFATFHHERTMAPGQLSFSQMKNVYNYERINSDTHVFGVIADPVGHSLSPVIHNAAFRKMKLNAVYVPFRVPREDLDAFLADARDLGIRGLSATIPHKEAIIAHANQTSDAVYAIGAANTLLLRKDGARAMNTDYTAAIASLSDSYGSHSGDEPLKGRRVLMLGAGGVARAIVYGLVEAGAEVIIASRTFSRAEDLAKKMGATPVEWDRRHDVRADVIVNGTPIGMHPEVDESPYDKRYMKPAMTVFDTVYNPERTLLIKHAREQKCRTVTGVDMFVRQAAEQFKLFTGHEAPIETMTEALKRTIQAARY